MSIKERNKIIEAVGKFNSEMIKKLLKKLDEGYSGWDNLAFDDYMQKELLRHVMKNDYIDVANIAMFLWILKTKGGE